jgi:hypothetical protein
MTNAEQSLGFSNRTKFPWSSLMRPIIPTGCLIQILIGKRIARCDIGNQPIGNCGRTAEY